MTKKHRCGDCGATTGQLHLDNCDIERCPKCRGQLYSCDCQFPKVTVDKQYLVDDKGKFYKRTKVKSSTDEDFGGDD